MSNFASKNGSHTSPPNYGVEIRGIFWRKYIIKKIDEKIPKLFQSKILKNLKKMDENKIILVAALNQALGWEMRAIAMYAHYAAYVSGIHRLHLTTHFNSEVTESVTHAATVRAAIVKLNGEATRDRDASPIEHTSNYTEMLKEAYKTEETAAKTYGEILPMVEAAGDTELYDALEVIYFDEQRSVEELRMMLMA